MTSLIDYFGILKIPHDFKTSFTIVKIGDYDLEMTCGACPEQYDVLLHGKKVAYLRLRHGYFSVHVPDCGGHLLWECTPMGDGVFMCEERHSYLIEAIKRIDHYYESYEG